MKFVVALLQRKVRGRGQRKTACKAFLRDYIRKHTASLHECSWSLDTRESPCS